MFEEEYQVIDQVPNPPIPESSPSHLEAVQSLSVEQREVFSEVMSAINSGQNGVRVVTMGSGGVGTPIKILLNLMSFQWCSYNSPFISRQESSDPSLVSTHETTDSRSY